MLARSLCSDKQISFASAHEPVIRELRDKVRIRLDRTKESLKDCPCLIRCAITMVAERLTPWPRSNEHHAPAEHRLSLTAAQCTSMRPLPVFALSAQCTRAQQVSSALEIHTNSMHTDHSQRFIKILGNGETRHIIELEPAQPHKSTHSVVAWAHNRIASSSHTVSS